MTLIKPLYSCVSKMTNKVSLHHEQYSPERSSSILLACCVLHNASLHSGLDAWTLERTEPLEQPKGPEQSLEDRDSEAEELRKHIILKHFS